MKPRAVRINTFAAAVSSAYPGFVPFSVRMAAAKAADDVVAAWYVDPNPMPRFRLWRWWP